MIPGTYHGRILVVNTGNEKLRDNFFFMSDTVEPTQGELGLEQGTKSTQRDGMKRQIERCISAGLYFKLKKF